MSGSGFAGLGHQVVWTQQFGVWLGHELVTVLAVVAAFFGGLSAGAWLLSRLISRAQRPALWYAECEGTMAVWAIVLTFCIPAMGSWLISLIGLEPTPARHWAVAFLGPFILLLPSTAAMGATLPAIERAMGRLRSEGYAIGSLYAANTAGAVVGVLGCAFVLVPWVGLNNTARVCAVISALCAVGAYGVWGRWRGGDADGAQHIAIDARGVSHSEVNALLITSGSTHSALITHPGRQMLALLFATGALGIGYEVLVVRVLSEVMEDTVYTFAILLALYLLGTAAGGALYQRYLARRETQSLRAHLLVGASAACLLSTCALWASPALKTLASALLGSALASEAVVAFVAFFLPAVAMGMLFSHLCVEAKHQQLGLGRAIAANTFGGALAPLVFGVLLLPAVGPKLALLSITLGYLLLSGVQGWRLPVPRLAASAVTVAVVALMIFAPSLAFIDVPEGGRIVRYEDGVSAAVSVIEDATGVSTLHIDNRQQEGSNATLLSDARQAWIPLLLHPKPQTALFLGLGTGLTASSASWDSNLKVDVVELLPEVVRASADFQPALESERFPNIVTADARRFVRTTDAHYDVIVADLFHPARSGAGALYTIEHFAAVKNRLATNGLFCQWLPIHQLDMDSLRSIVAAFIAVYPHATALLATNSLSTPTLGLIGRMNETGVLTDELNARIAHSPPATRLRELHLEDELAVLGSFVAGPDALRRFASGAVVNTDDHPVVTHRAPFLTYAPTSEPRERLIALLHSFDIEPSDVLADDNEAARVRLAAYWSARTHFLEVGTQVRQSDDVQTMLTQVRAPLLSILRASPDFRPAYDPLLNMAAALAQENAAAARALLAELANTQPARPEAHMLLQQLATVATPPKT